MAYKFPDRHMLAKNISLLKYLAHMIHLLCTHTYDTHTYIHYIHEGSWYLIILSNTCILLLVQS